MLSSLARLPQTFRACAPRSTRTSSRTAAALVRATDTVASTCSSSSSLVTSNSSRTYVSRAHPSPVPEFAVNAAMDEILNDIRRRHRRRARKWKANAEHRQIKDPAAALTAKCSHPDETIELSLNLNLDPRKPGQALRGSLSLPHGTGKTSTAIVFTNDTALQEAALKAGALHAGGDSLVEQVLQGEVSVDSFDRALASSDMMPLLSKKVARLLGPRGLMPNAKVGTLVPADELLEALDTQLTGKELQFRTEKEGIVHVPVGMGSFGTKKLLENIGQVMKTIFESKPESFGKGKKKGASGKGTKYMLRASLSSTQGPGMRLDLRTVDPTSAFFLSSVETIKGDEEEKEVQAVA